MLEAIGDIWTHAKDYDAVVITTNGYVKQNGEAVMGRGIALEAKKRYPKLPQWVGYHIKTYGNHAYCLGVDFDPDIGKATYLITMPVKPEYGPNGEPGWKTKADLKLIEQSAYELMDNFSIKLLSKILMPRPGCGNGKLRWENVKPVIEPILDDRFTVMEYD